MGFDPLADARRKTETNRQILECGFRIFSQRAISKITMAEVAEAAGIGVATLYRYYRTKQALVMGVNAWIWDRVLQESIAKLQAAERSGWTAVTEYTFFLDRFLDLYHNHPDILRFNQFFNVYVRLESIPEDARKAFASVTGALEDYFHKVFLKARQDGSLRTDVAENDMFWASLHLMMAAVTRHAVGLVYDAGIDPDRELALLKNMLLDRYAVTTKL